MKYFLLIWFFPFNIFAQSPSLQTNFYISGFNSIVDIAHAFDDRLFVVDGTQIKVIENNSILANPFLDLTGNADWIMAVAFHPNYQAKGQLFVKYRTLDNTCRISRFLKSSDDKNQVDKSSENVLFSIVNNIGHQGGDLEFGKDGYLYTTTGDGAPGERFSLGDENNNAQNMSSLKGKLLRFNVDSENLIPIENPYQTPNDNIPDEIIAAGLRNPWKFSFDKLTGDLWIGDVGQDSYEEIDYLPFGNFENKNFGWSCYEGNMLHLTQNCPPNSVSLVSPIITYEGYNFNGNLPASVTGGYVYRGSKYPFLNGFYCYADYNSGKFWLLKNTNNVITYDFKGVLMEYPTTFGEDYAGELYVATFDKIYKITSCGNEQNLTITSNLTGRNYFSSLNLIESSAQILNGGEVFYSSSKMISLNPGFKVDNGAVFIAQIDSCN
ncbi:sorbosone dehydrogenase family protein [Emticicia oligotrophica]|uniref:PQQ-dependent sugar dehydrogenase n=1 Tax=Emticicia oligotrophica TaxID=312279 RepID=UPI00273C8B6A|nr:PQQ-dependent sugar dehydrogenase [Emticicia oligotrophica]